jgi:glycosyltransferase involved in cell wall biosynthesis
MDILIVGGTPSHRGGVELFCERARDALVNIGGHHVEWVLSETAYFKIASLGRVSKCVLQLLRARHKRWDCLWLQYVNLPDLVLLSVCRLLGYRVLVTPHLGSNWSSQSNLLLRGLGVRLLGLAHGIALIATIQAEELTLPSGVQRFQINTFLPRAFPTNTGLVRRQNGILAIVHAGRLSAGKGTFLFLEVCSILKRRGCTFSAQLIGYSDDATRRRIDAVIQENDLASRVTVVGSLPESQLLTELAQADALIHLSDIDSFPLIVLEAIGCGAYPICKNLPGARLIIQTYCGRLVEGPSAVAEVAELLIGTTPSSLHAATMLATERITADFAWGRCVAALESVIVALGQSRPMPFGQTSDAQPSSTTRRGESE